MVEVEDSMAFWEDCRTTRTLNDDGHTAHLATLALRSRHANWWLGLWAAVSERAFKGKQKQQAMEFS
jgi:hypothetical protein